MSRSLHLCKSLNKAIIVRRTGILFLSKKHKHVLPDKLYKGYYTKRIIHNQYTALRYFNSTHNKQQPLNYNLLSITEHPNPQNKANNIYNTSYGSTTDHMLEINHTKLNGWSTPHIRPYSFLSLDPATSALQHANQAFEGLKACIDLNNKDKIRIFRPNDHLHRLQKTAKILGLPSFDAQELLHCLYELLTIDKQWIPTDIYGSLYMRPVLMDTTPTIDIVECTESKLFVILNEYGSKGVDVGTAISVFADTKYVRSWSGYIGIHAKTGCNYSHVIRSDMEAVVRGYSTALWLYPNSMDNADYICGLSAMNIFFVVDGNQKQLITPSLTNDLVFDGITRDCIIKIAKEWNELEVVEKDITMNEIVCMITDNQITEAFGCGTANVVTPIDRIGYKDRDYIIKSDTNSQSIAQRLYSNMLDYQYGAKPHEWSVQVPKF